MTRINCGIPPAELHDKHLLAEHREIKRIPNTIASGKAVIQNIPDSFRLGSGHVKFFYNKLGYLLKRYKAIHAECLNRGYKVTDYENCWQGLPKNLMLDYKPKEQDKLIVRQRIYERLKAMKQKKAAI